MRTKTTAATTATASKTSASTPARKSPAKPRKQSRIASVAPATTPAGTIPPQCFTARVTPEDALWIANRCKQGGNIPPWIVAGVLAEAGASVLTGDNNASPFRPEVWLKKPASHYIWLAINREEIHHSEEIPAFLPPGERGMAECDAESMRRDLGDWVGTLIMVGIELAEADKTLVTLTHWRGFDLLADRYKFKLIEEEQTGKLTA